MKILIVHERLIPEYADMYWFYVGKNQEVYSKLESRYGINNLFVKPDILYNHIRNNRKNVISWMDNNLANQYLDRWMALSFLKNPFMSDFVLHLIYLLHFKKMINLTGKNILVVCDSFHFSKTLYNYLKKDGYEVYIYGNAAYYITSIKFMIKNLASFAIQIIKILDRVLLSKLILGFSYRKKMFLNSPEILIDTYMHENSISDDGLYTDRYFPGLYEYYIKSGTRAAMYPWLYVKGRNYINIYRRIKKSNTSILIPEYYLKFIDIGKTIIHCIFASLYPLRTKSIKFEGIDVSTLLRSHRTQISLNLFMAKVLQKVPYRLASYGLNPKVLMEWYENQPLDKANLLGFSTVFNHLKIIACMQFLPSFNFFSLFSGTREIQNNASPKYYRVMGKALIPSFNQYDGIGEYSSVPALRYQNIYDGRRENSVKNETSSLLVLLTHSYDESSNVIRLLLSSIHEVNKNFKKIIIRLHPDMKLDEFLKRKNLGELRNQKIIRWSENPLYDDFSMSSLVMSSGTSSALEAVAYGLPVIIVGEKFRLTINPLEEINQNFWKIVYYENDLRSAIMDWWAKTNFRTQKFINYAQKIKRTYFEEATPENMYKFLKY